MVTQFIYYMQTETIVRSNKMYIKHNLMALIYMREREGQKKKTNLTVIYDLVSVSCQTLFQGFDQTASGLFLVFYFRFVKSLFLRVCLP